jgi:REST corepressor 1
VISARGKTYRAEADINRQYNQCGLANGIDSYRIPGRLKIRPNQRWTEEERMLCVHGMLTVLILFVMTSYSTAFRRYGKDMQAIAEMIGTKSLEMVREFYREYQQKYRLDYVILKLKIHYI